MYQLIQSPSTIAWTVVRDDLPESLIGGLPQRVGQAMVAHLNDRPPRTHADVRAIALGHVGRSIPGVAVAPLPGGDSVAIVANGLGLVVDVPFSTWQIVHLASSTVLVSCTALVPTLAAFTALREAAPCLDDITSPVARSTVAHVVRLHTHTGRR